MDGQKVSDRHDAPVGRKYFGYVVATPFMAFSGPPAWQSAHALPAGPFATRWTGHCPRIPLRGSWRDRGCRRSSEVPADGYRGCARILFGRRHERRVALESLQECHDVDDFFGREDSGWSPWRHAGIGKEHAGSQMSSNRYRSGRRRSPMTDRSGPTLPAGQTSSPGMR